MTGELFDRAGRRKYLTHDERKAFLKAADRAPREVRTFCHLLHFSGCRISEALALTYDRVDFANGTEPQEAPGRRLPLSPRAPHPARRAGPGVQHPGDGSQARARAQGEDLDVGAHDGLAEGQGGEGGGQILGKNRRSAPRGCGTASGLPPSRRASR